MALIKFDIPHRSRRCNPGQEEFIPGMEYVSVLDEGDKEKYERKDYCIPCWEKLLNSKEASLGKIHWKSAVPTRKQESLSSIRRDERALELLKEIHQNGDEEEAAEAFILALLLVRKKILQLKQEITEPNNPSVLFYEVAGTEEMIGIKKVDLSHIQAEKIQAYLAQKLNNPT